MTDLPLTKLGETTKTITLGWTPPAGAIGYVLYADGVRKSNSWDPAKSSWKTNKANEIRIVALGVQAEGFYPGHTPPPLVGTVLPGVSFGGIGYGDAERAKRQAMIADAKAMVAKTIRVQWWNQLECDHAIEDIIAAGL